jgi:hypothetical protein
MRLCFTSATVTPKGGSPSDIPACFFLIYLLSPLSSGDETGERPDKGKRKTSRLSEGVDLRCPDMGVTEKARRLLRGHNSPRNDGNTGSPGDRSLASTPRWFDIRMERGDGKCFTIVPMTGSVGLASSLEASDISFGCCTSGCVGSLEGGVGGGCLGHPMRRHCYAAMRDTQNVVSDGEYRDPLFPSPLASAA